MTTNTTNSQAASIVDDIEFWNLIEAYTAARGPATKENLALCAHIDTKLRNAASMGYLKASEDHKELLDGYGDRAEKAESRLAEIQRGVEGLDRYGFDGTFGGDFGWWPDGVYISRTEVLALLAPQGQASERKS